jgi:hypothetical protein
MTESESQAFKTLPRISPGSLPPRTPIDVATPYLQTLLGCYRIGEANDPERYTLAALAVLTCFDESTIAYVCDPRTGLPGDLKWLPSIAELKDALNARAAYEQRLAELEARPKPTPRLPPPPVTRGPGFYANCKISQGSPRYAELLEWAQNGGDPLYWKIEAGELWVEHGVATGMRRPIEASE